MFVTSIAVLIRIFSNSLANVYQKQLAAQGVNPFFINFVMYTGLTICCLPFVFGINWLEFSWIFWTSSILGGLFGALGNSYLVKALEKGELSVLGPINAYKSVVAMVAGIFLLGEIPSVTGIFAVTLIILGSYFVFDTQEEGFSFKLLKRADIRYRIYALVFTAIEAVFIKNVISESSVFVSFVMWSFWGMVFTGCIYFCRRHAEFISASCFPEVFNGVRFRNKLGMTFFNLFMVIILMGLMQLSTNFIFERMNVSYGLALFQLSTILSVILGWKCFKEGHILKKLLGTFIMVVGAVILILL